MKRMQGSPEDVRRPPDGERQERQEPDGPGRPEGQDEGAKRRGGQPRMQPGLPRRRVIVAKFESRCSTCGELYDKGTEIVSGPNGWEHVGCSDGDMDKVKTRNMMVQAPCSFTETLHHAAPRMTPLGDKEQEAWET